MDTMECLKRKHTTITVKKKQEIIGYQVQHPAASHRTISEHFARLWQCDIKRRTVCDIIQQKRKWMAVTETDIKHQKSAKYPELEMQLRRWCEDVRLLAVRNHAPLGENAIRVKARELGADLGIVNFSYSNGWLQRFKQRNGITQCAPLNIEDIEDVAGDMEDVISLVPVSPSMQGYSPADVYGVEKIAINAEQTPDMSRLTPNGRITILLTFNSDGTDKRTPLVVGNVKMNPNCNVTLDTEYSHEENAHLTPTTFNDWLLNFDGAMRQQRRHVLLMLDERGRYHVTSCEHRLTNVKVHAHECDSLRPLTAAFKVVYRCQHIGHVIDSVAKTGDHVMYADDVLRFVNRAWQCVSPTTILDYWRQTGLPFHLGGGGGSVHCSAVFPGGIGEEYDNEAHLTELVRQVIPILKIEHPMTVEEYLRVDDNTYNLIDDDDAFNVLADDIVEDSLLLDRVKVECLPDIIIADAHHDDSLPSNEDAILALDVLVRYVESHPVAVQSDLNMVLELRNRIDTIANNISM